MKLGVLFGFWCALVLHALVLFFGGLIFGTGDKDVAAQQEVELLSEDDSTPKKDEKQEPDPVEELETENEDVPDASEILRSLEAPPVIDGPALDAASLSAIEAALNGQGGAGGDFAQALSFASGGHIGFSGKGGPQDQELEGAFSLADIDQHPQATFKAAALYPAEMRGKKLEAVVTLIFVVDANGKVVNPRVEKSSHTAFERPALDAIRQWKFEPGVKAGKRVACKVRLPIRFQPN